MSIVSFFFCWPASVAAILFTLQAKKLLEQGQLDAARAKVKTAQLIAAIAIGLGVLMWGIYIVLAIIR